MKNPLLSRFCLLAGSIDLATGLLLVIAPTMVFAWLELAPKANDLFFPRYLGVFVGAVGASYFLPRVLGSGREGWRMMLAITALIRLAVALFLTLELVMGTAALTWIGVLLTDLILAAVQIFHFLPRVQESK